MAEYDFGDFLHTRNLRHDAVSLLKVGTHFQPRIFIECSLLQQNCIRYPDLAYVVQQGIPVNLAQLIGASVKRCASTKV